MENDTICKAKEGFYDDFDRPGPGLDGPPHEEAHRLHVLEAMYINDYSEKNAGRTLEDKDVQAVLGMIAH